MVGERKLDNDGLNQYNNRSLDKLKNPFSLT